MDEARVGQKGRLCHRWWTRGRRPPGRCDQRYQWTYIFAAVEPATGAEVALVLPEATTATMNLFLAELAAGLPGDVQAALVLDGAGWHVARALVVPPNITLVPLPPYSPELNAIERLWQVMRDTLLSHRLFTDLNHIIEVCCTTWNAPLNQSGRIRSTCGYAWAAPVKTS